MIRIEDFASCGILEDENRIFVNSEKSSMKNSAITFNGKRNIIYVKDGAHLSRSKIVFNGNDSVIYIGSGKSECMLNFSINNKSAIYIGRDSYYNGVITAVTSEGQSIIFGDRGLFSYGISVRTADPHLLYDIESGERINPSKSVVIGDHVWIGQNVLILKGTVVGSGAVIGAAAVVSNKHIGSNTVWAGNPARKLKSGVFFDRRCVHGWDEDMTEKNKRSDSDTTVFGKERNGVIDTSELCSRLYKAHTSEEKLAIIKDTLASNTAKDRFYSADK